MRNCCSSAPRWAPGAARAEGGGAAASPPFRTPAPSHPSQPWPRAHPGLWCPWGRLERFNALTLNLPGEDPVPAASPAEAPLSCSSAPAPGPAGGAGCSLVAPWTPSSPAPRHGQSHPMAVPVADGTQTSSRQLREFAETQPGRGHRRCRTAAPSSPWPAPAHGKRPVEAGARCHTARRHVPSTQRWTHSQGSGTAARKVPPRKVVAPSARTRCKAHLSLLLPSPGWGWRT